MPKLSELLKETRAVQVEIDGEMVNVTYRLKAMTSALYQEWMAGWGKASDTSDTMAAHIAWIRGVLASLIASWDVLRDDGTPWPTTDTPDGLQSLPFIFLETIWGAIWQDMYPNLSGGGTSSAK